jgi:hypothetical protein
MFADAWSRTQRAHPALSGWPSAWINADFLRPDATFTPQKNYRVASLVREADDRRF